METLEYKADGRPEMAEEREHFHREGKYPPSPIPARTKSSSSLGIWKTEKGTLMTRPPK